MKTATFRLDATESELFTLRRILRDASRNNQGVWAKRRVPQADLKSLLEKTGADVGEVS